MGNAKNCCSFDNRENIIEAKFENNENISYFSLLNDQELRLNKIKQKIAIEKILKQFKKYKAKK